MLIKQVALLLISALLYSCENPFGKLEKPETLNTLINEKEESKKLTQGDLFTFYQENEKENRVVVISGSPYGLQQTNSSHLNTLRIERKNDNSEWEEKQTVRIPNCKGGAVKYENSFATAVTLSENNNEILIAISYKHLKKQEREKEEIKAEAAEAEAEETEEEAKEDKYDYCLYAYSKDKDSTIWSSKPEYINSYQYYQDNANENDNNNDISADNTGETDETDSDDSENDDTSDNDNLQGDIIRLIKNPNYELMTGWMIKNKKIFYFKSKDQKKAKICIADLDNNKCIETEIKLAASEGSRARSYKVYKDRLIIYDRNNIEGVVTSGNEIKIEKINNENIGIFKVDCYQKDQNNINYIVSGLCYENTSDNTLTPCIKTYKDKNVEDTTKYTNLNFENKSNQNITDDKNKYFDDIMKQDVYKYIIATINDKEDKIAIGVTEKNTTNITQSFYTKGFGETLSMQNMLNKINKKTIPDQEIINTHQEWGYESFYYNFIKQSSTTDQDISGIKEIK